MKAIDKRVAAQLLSAGELAEADLQKAIAGFAGQTAPLHEYLVVGGYVSARAAARALACANGLPFVDIDDSALDPEAVAMIGVQEAWRRELLPLTLRDGMLVVALSNINDVFVQDELRMRLGCPVEVRVAERSDLILGLARAYGTSPSGERALPANAPLPTELPTSDEVSHREFQRRMRELRESGDAHPQSTGISGMETVVRSDDDSTRANDTPGNALPPLAGMRRHRSPLAALGLSVSAHDDLLRKLTEPGFGLLLLSAPTRPALDLVYDAVMATAARNGRGESFSIETTSRRLIPGVTPMRCDAGPKLLDVLGSTLAKSPAVVGVLFIEDSQTIQALARASTGGVSLVAGLVARDGATARAAIRAAGLEPMNVVRGILGHVHRAEVRKLCAACARAIADAESLPAWARDTGAQFLEAAGCDACAGSGYAGSVPLIEYAQPDLLAADGTFREVVERHRDILAASLAGETDPREHGLSA